MKSEVAISLSSSLLLLLLFLSGPSLASSLVFPPPKPVLDTQGHPVLVGSKYYLESVFFGGASGGATMGPPRNGTCPLDVVRDRPLFDGLPVTLTLADGSGKKGTAVHTSTSLKIEFTGHEADIVNTCQSSMKWSVGTNDVETGLRVITTGGSASVFTIAESGVPSTHTFYNLVYCGSSICVGNVCTADLACRAVGEIERRLYAGGPTFAFYFHKA